MDGDITADTKVSAVAELWFRDVEESDQAIRTKITYRETWVKSLASAVGELRLRDMRVSRVDRVVRELRERSGPGTAKHARVVLSGVGCRIGEPLALDWTRVDDQAGSIAAEGTAIRVPKVGLIVQPSAKSKAGIRTITVPLWVMELLKRRHQDSAGPWVFPSTSGGLRDPDNTRKQLREVVRGTEWQGLHPHAFRHLVATRLDAKGLSAREIAACLGHERISMTQDVYMSRGVSGAAAAAAMDGLDPAQ